MKRYSDQISLWYNSKNSDSEYRFKSSGFLQYHGEDKLVLRVCYDLSEYYKWFIPFCMKYNRPRYPPHITVVRTGIETIQNKDKWKEHEGEKIPFLYDPYLYIDDTYIWLKAYSNELQKIRMELGLPAMRERFGEFHITVANRKNITY